MATAADIGIGELELVLTGLDNNVELVPVSKNRKKGPSLPRNTVSLILNIVS